MPPVIASASRSAVVLVDLQPSFLKAIWQQDRVIGRTEFLIRSALSIGVPVLATEQNTARMGGTCPEIAALLPVPPFPKMPFSCVGCGKFVEALESSGRRQAVIVGIETHICVSQTAHHLLERGYEVIVCADTVSSRTEDRHLIGLERMRAAGAAIAHSESVVYEWLDSADNPVFRDVLKIVKEFG